MNALIMLDKDAKTALSEDLRARITGSLAQKGHTIQAMELGKNVAPCFGCLSCLTKHPGECISKDIVWDVIKNVRRYDMTVYLTPVLFGHFSSAIKNAMDRGTGSHNLQVVIGYGGDMDDEEESTFIDLVVKHRGKADVVHPGMDRRVDAFVTRSLADNAAICDALESILVEAQ